MRLADQPAPASNPALRLTTETMWRRPASTTSWDSDRRFEALFSTPCSPRRGGSTAVAPTTWPAVLVGTTQRASSPSAGARPPEIRLRFLADAQSPDGRYRNRIKYRPRPLRGPPNPRGLLGPEHLGPRHGCVALQRRLVAGERHRTVSTAQSNNAPNTPARWPSPTVGAAQLLAAEPRHRGARSLLADAADAMALRLQCQMAMARSSAALRERFAPRSHDHCWQYTEGRACCVTAFRCSPGCSTTRPHRTVICLSPPERPKGPSDARPAFDQRAR